MTTRILTVMILGLCLVTAPALADWGHPVKWDQLNPEGPPSAWAAVSRIDPDVGAATSADDFACRERGWITEVEFAGWSVYEEKILGFQIAFWNDVAATPEDESHPGELLYAHTFTSWEQMGDALPYTYKINMPRDFWFEQHGSADEAVVYWISIQAVFPSDGVWNNWGWSFRDRYDEPWGDDCAFESDDHEPWWNRGWPTETGDPDLYDGPFPDGWWKSADMAFRLSGIPIPEPGVFALAGLGLLALLRRRKTMSGR